MVDQARMQTVYARTLEALQDVIRELKITQDELHAVADWLNRVGAAGEFPLLLDVVLAVTSAEATYSTVPETTAVNIEGPFYLPGAPERSDGRLYDRAPGGKLLRVSGRVTDAVSGALIPGAELDVWQADENGSYDLQGYHLRGIIKTDVEGRYSFESVVPAPYEIPKEGPTGELVRALGRHAYRPAHLHYKVRVGGQERLTTQVFFAGDPYLDSDVVEGAVKPQLIVPLQPVDGAGPARETYAITFDIALAPAPVSG